MPQFNLVTNEADRDRLTEMAQQLGAAHARHDFPLRTLEAQLPEHGRWLAGNELDHTNDLADDAEVYLTIFASAYAQACIKVGAELQATTMYYADTLPGKVVVTYDQRLWIVPRVPNGWEARDQYHCCEQLMPINYWEAEIRAACGIPAAS